jgi:hypothetical protein
MPNLLLTRESPHFSRVPALGLGSNWRRMRHLKMTGQVRFSLEDSHWQSHASRSNLAMMS